VLVYTALLLKISLLIYLGFLKYVTMVYKENSPSKPAFKLDTFKPLIPNLY